MTRAPLEITTETRRLAAELLECKRHIDWLTQVQAQARGRGMPVLSKAIGAELNLQRGMFWRRADQLGMTTVPISEITLLARRLEAATER